jgi:choline dehydrogenase-like flavoprotein
MSCAGASQYHGDKGAMKVESPRYYNELHGAFFEAAAAAGLARNPDFNEWNRPQVRCASGLQYWAPSQAQQQQQQQPSMQPKVRPCERAQEHSGSSRVVRRSHQHCTGNA